MSDDRLNRAGNFAESGFLLTAGAPLVESPESLSIPIFPL
jgi:hypothetical protein